MRSSHVAFAIAVLAVAAGAETAPPKRLSLDLGDGGKLELTLIPAGTFTMGSTDTRPKLPETPPHKVTISKPFYMGVYEVTQRQYQAVTGKNPTRKEFQNADHPVESINWQRAMTFCREASKKTGMTVRLPTEAEWEYACRAGTTTKFFWGDTTREMNQYAWTPANSKVNGKTTTHPVGKLKPNPWGLYDICGNVFEFCSDNYRDDWHYPDKPVTDPTGAPEATKRKRKVLRGGAFNMGWVRSAQRCWGPLGTSGRDHGMRVVVNVPAADAKPPTSAPATAPAPAEKPASAKVQALSFFTSQAGEKTGDWPGWRGPGRNSISPDSSGWPEAWPPKRLWGVKVGRGSSSPLIVAGRLYVMGWRGKARGNDNPVGTDTVWCFQARTGKVLWKQAYPCRKQSRRRIGNLNSYAGPLSTPAFDTETQRLYTMSIDGDLRCWDAAADGKLIWAKNLYEAYDIPSRPAMPGGRRDFGFTSSPLILGDAVIVEAGAREGTVLAFDKATGKERWRSELTGPAGHTSGPVALTLGGRSCLATLTLKELVFLRADAAGAGRSIAECAWATNFGCNIPSPTPLDGGVMVTSNYNHRRSALFALSGAKAKRKWQSRGYATVSSPVAYKGRAWLINNALQCVDTASGELKWRGGNFGNGTCMVTAGDDKLLAFGRGKLALLAATGNEDQYRELARLDKVVPGTCYPHLALSDGVLCCKDHLGNVVCLSVHPPTAVD